MQHLFNCIIIIATTVLMYARTIEFGYVIDDIGILNKKKHDKWWMNWWWEFRGTIHYEPRREHAYSLILHTLVCLMIYWLFGGTNVALLTAILFCLNPSNNQGAVWLSGRPYMTGTLLILIGFKLTFLFPIIYILASFLSNMILAPLAFLYFKPHILILTILFYPMLYYRYNTARPLTIRKKETTPEMTKVKTKKLILLCKSYTYYFFLSIFPLRTGMYHRFCYTFGLRKEDNDEWYQLSPLFWSGVILLGIITINIVWNWNDTVMGLAWFTLFVLQWCNLITLQQPIAERYVYLPNIGMMYALASFILYLPKPYSHILATAFLIFYATKLYFYLPAYRNNLEYFLHNVLNFPKLHNAYNSYGAELAIRGKYGAAIDIWLDGLALRNNDYKLNSNVGSILMKLGNFPAAVAYLKKARESVIMNTGEKDLIPDVENKIKACEEQISIMQHNQQTFEELKKQGVIK